MHIAVEKGNIEIINLLLARQDIDINKTNNEIFFFWLLMILNTIIYEKSLWKLLKTEK